MNNRAFLVFRAELPLGLRSHDAERAVNVVRKTTREHLRSHSVNGFDVDVTRVKYPFDYGERPFAKAPYLGERLVLFP